MRIDNFFQWIVNIPVTLAPLVKWLTTPLNILEPLGATGSILNWLTPFDLTVLNVTPLQLFSVPVIILLLTIHFMRLFTI